MDCVRSLPKRKSFGERGIASGMKKRRQRIIVPRGRKNAALTWGKWKVKSPRANSRGYYAGIGLLEMKKMEKKASYGRGGGDSGGPCIALEK